MENVNWPSVTCSYRPYEKTQFKFEGNQFYEEFNQMRFDIFNLTWKCIPYPSSTKISDLVEYGLIYH